MNWRVYTLKNMDMIGRMDERRENGVLNLLSGGMSGPLRKGLLELGLIKYQTKIQLVGL